MRHTVARNAVDFGFIGSLLPWVAMIVFAAWARVGAQTHQTGTLTPVLRDQNLGYTLQIQPFDFGAANLPTLHSFASGRLGDEWILLAGRTNGLHGFEFVGGQNFPVAFQNREVWVINPVTRQSWRRSLQDVQSGLTPLQLAALSSTNTQFSQISERLYISGGYGTTPVGGFTTFDTLTAVDLPGIRDWVKGGPGTAAEHLRQIQDPLFRVTGGDMHEIDGRMHLVFGHDFQGGYTPGKNGQYTKQVRSFEIADDGQSLGIRNATMTTPEEHYRRRDLNVFPTLRRDTQGGLEEGLTVLSGVFTTDFGAWTVPVEIDGQGTPSMADPLAPGTFRQAMNNYHSAKLGLYSERRDQMQEVLFGGITLQYYDESSQAFAQDDFLPFTNQITAVVRDGQGTYAQHWLGEFPAIDDLEGNRLRFGTNAEFFRAGPVPHYDNGVIRWDELRQPTVLGYIFGGIFANAPHVRGSFDAVSGASNRIFEVRLIPEISVADLNADGAVDALDAGLLFVQWSQVGTADINVDGIVDAADAGILFSHWTGETARVPEAGGIWAAICVIAGYWRSAVRRVGDKRTANDDR